MAGRGLQPQRWLLVLPLPTAWPLLHPSLPAPGFGDFPPFEPQGHRAVTAGFSCGVGLLPASMLYKFLYACFWFEVSKAPGETGFQDVAVQSVPQNVSPTPPTGILFNQPSKMVARRFGGGGGGRVGTVSARVFLQAPEIP